MMPIDSIRARIQWILMPMLAVTLVVTASLVYFVSRDELNDALNAQLELIAQTSAALYGDRLAYSGQGDMDLEKLLDRLAHEDDFFVLIRDGKGNTVYSSQPHMELPKNLRHGSYRQKVLGRPWHIVVWPSVNSDRTYITGRFEEESRELIWQLVGTAILPLSLVFVLTLIISIISVRLGLSPLLKLSHHLEKRPPNNLEPIDVSDQPKEIKPIVEALNGLFERISAFIKRERQFVDDAAHEIRTPLTVIKAQAQALNRDGMDKANLMRIDHITTGIDRVARLSKQLLQQARAEKEVGMLEEVDVRQLMMSMIGEFDSVASRQSVTLSLECERETPMVGMVNRDDVWTILRNITENAVRYSGRPGEVLIGITNPDDHHVVVVVEDNGRGIAPEMQERVFERFFRDVPNTSSSDQTPSDGAGLGLSIVKALVERNNLDLAIAESDRLGGAAFRLKIPSFVPSRQALLSEQQR